MTVPHIEFCSTNICIADSIILEKVRQKMPTIKTGIAEFMRIAFNTK